MLTVLSTSDLIFISNCDFHRLKCNYYAIKYVYFRDDNHIIIKLIKSIETTSIEFIVICSNKQLMLPIWKQFTIIIIEYDDAVTLQLNLIPIEHLIKTILEIKSNIHLLFNFEIHVTEKTTETKSNLFFYCVVQLSFLFAAILLTTTSYSLKPLLY